ncbi:glycosyltransferase family 2 protein [Thioalkalivibrio sp. XN8]|uniref:glycosyltransferase family 2 protein n=1 Tax=Thioalkalivibrio sp. XN8 TaxID=2712863 RepID=UPI0013EA347D|nr:glycosyltransferase family 2 protein [Thioalkalivibrio sp. XN8]NGP53679.1 glycosyltransferase family 2 protein [Thioalkalivibrio sp. XN8]
MPDTHRDSDPPPRISFGLFVRNEVETIETCIDSILGQTLADIELVISDNASDDGTREILQKYAERDGRVRLYCQEQNLGLIDNVNFVIRACQGEFVRLIGGHDWLEPNYAQGCVAAAEDNPGAIVVTTDFDIRDEYGHVRIGQYQGQRLESESPLERLRMMLFFFKAGDAEYDPVYSAIRRDVLMKTGLIRMMEHADLVLSVELSLIGHFAHVNHVLAHRLKRVAHYKNRQAVFKSYRPEQHLELKTSATRLLREFSTVAWRSNMSLSEKLSAQASFLFFYVRRVWRKRHLPFLRRTVKHGLRKLGLRRHNQAIKEK